MSPARLCLAVGFPPPRCRACAAFPPARLASPCRVPRPGPAPVPLGEAALVPGCAASCGMLRRPPLPGLPPQLSARAAGAISVRRGSPRGSPLVKPLGQAGQERVMLEETAGFALPVLTSSAGSRNKCAIKAQGNLTSKCCVMKYYSQQLLRGHSRLAAPPHSGSCPAAVASAVPGAAVI